MTQIIVPLAGPDFVDAKGQVKAEHVVDGKPLLRRALDSRPWANDVTPDKYVFIMFDRPETRSFARDRIVQWYPGARIVFVSHYTRGAAISALAGMAAYSSPAEQIIVDLADILYVSHLDPQAEFTAHPDCGGIALTFESNADIYSYLKCDASGDVIEAAEKRVISSHASAGTYLFSDGPTLLRAIAHAIENEAEQAYNNLLYVCPLFNGVIAQGRKVRVSQVTNVIDLKTMGADYDK